MEHTPPIIWQTTLIVFLISRYEDEIKSLEEYIQELVAENTDIINISSSSSENSFYHKHNYEEEVNELKQTNEELNKLFNENEQIISDAKEMYYTLKQEYKKLINENRELMLEKIKFQERYTDFGKWPSFNNDV